jgi:hypothetical protein
MIAIAKPSKLFLQSVNSIPCNHQDLDSPSHALQVSYVDGVMVSFLGTVVRTGEILVI